MFAAFAIGAWELSAFLIKRWHWQWSRTAAFVVTALCLLVIAVRYAYRFYRRIKHPEKPDPDAWKNY